MTWSKATIKELKLFIKQRGAPKAKSIEVRVIWTDFLKNVVVVFRIRIVFFFKRPKKELKKMGARFKNSGGKVVNFEEIPVVFDEWVICW